MSIKKYTNIDAINNKTDNQGQYLQSEDLFIISNNEIEDTDFGDCERDVMEVSVYDINNNLLPHKTGNNVAYIKPNNIKDYLYNIINKGGQKELAINIEKLLNDLGFTNGILKVNINFVRNRVGTDNDMTRVWIQEVSPSREEIRIVPLKTKDTGVNTLTNNQFKNLDNLHKDFKYYKKNILDSLDRFEATSLTKIDDVMVAKFGNDFINVLRKDFGLRDFKGFRTRIFENFRDSIKNWVNNKYYDISQSNFAKPSEKRFDDCEQYDFNMLMNSIQSILNNCISFNIKTLKRRNIDFKQLPKEFAIVELRKQIQDNINSFSTRVDIKRNIYSPDVATINTVGTKELPPIQTIIEKKIAIEKPIILQPTPLTEPVPDVKPPQISPTKPKLKDTEFSTAAQQEIGLGIGGGGSSTKYIPAGLNGTNQYYNGFDDRGFADADTDITGRDF